jgi:DNA ligase D-like protein (predicted 3'-phosphoesterase)
VVQEHSATRLHWDLRLERDGVAVSWAVPNGIPEVPGENRKAVHTEDHPLEYLEWEGVIPKGNYGAGTMKVWDSGTYECHEWTGDKVTVTFHGERLTGRYHLFQAGRDEKDWMIRRVDPPADPDREPMPAHVVPVVPVPGPLPAGDADHAYEIQWEGRRAIAFCEPGRLRLEDGLGGEIGELFPEVRRLTRQIGARSAVLDGELVALGADGRPDPKRLERRARPGSESTVRTRAREFPVVYEIYDLVYLDGRSLTALPWRERRARLRSLELGGDNWRVSQHHEGDGAALLEAARANGLPGIVAKPLDSPYAPGAGWIAVAAEERPQRLEPSSAYYRAVAPVLLAHAWGRKAGDKAVDSYDALLSMLVEEGDELDVTLALAGDLERPTYVVFALEAADIADCAEVSLLLRGMFQQLELQSFAKTTGADGLHVYVPLNSGATFEQTGSFAKQVAGLLRERRPEVPVDWSANAPGGTAVCAYSLRSGERPAVSTPVTWEEVEAGELDHDQEDVIERIAELGDLFAPVLSLVQSLPR